MKRFLAVLVLVALLSGCSADHSSVEKMVAFRNQLTGDKECTFTANITADYGDKVYVFGMACKTDSDGSLSFTVLQPETISGISGKITQSDGRLTFDDRVLIFETISEGLVTPVAAPWLMIHSLESGYIISCTDTNDGMFVQVQDSYADESVMLEMWFNEQNVPVSAELIWGGMRFLSMEIENFTIV